jgi:CheY-like chemotaxis protein
MSELRAILYVEDDPDIREIAVFALEQVGGYSVTPCDGGACAIDSVAASPPDLVLLDVMMPGMDGPTTLRALQDNPAMARIPVVFVTAKIQSSEVAAYLAMGAVDVIAKPFDPMTLSTQVQAIWDRLQ